MFLPPLLAGAARLAPRIDIGLRQLLPQSGVNSPARAWESGLAELEARAVDVAILPVDDVPARFAERTLYEEEFVIAARVGHPYLAATDADALLRDAAPCRVAFGRTARLRR